jgi:hypothetical protein
MALQQWYPADESLQQPFHGLWSLVLAAILKAYSAPDDTYLAGSGGGGGIAESFICVVYL